MSTRLTKDISIIVNSKFETEHSDISKNQFVFSYHIRITNNSNESVQLLSRHWYIFDSNGEYNEVKGEGVIGLQPIIDPGKSHEYQSYCNLRSDIGMMWGSYLMKKLSNEKLFEVQIPEFHLITPNRLN
ncbi:MAG: Co2+/Mg2+ efflux protein ApaG [Flavobacteriales bacterium]|nr:Co2+/Mg2+ efflux protein ApaG [Flavobacteriales bacterium]